MIALWDEFEKTTVDGNGWRSCSPDRRDFQKVTEQHEGGNITNSDGTLDFGGWLLGRVRSLQKEATK